MGLEGAKESTGPDHGGRQGACRAEQEGAERLAEEEKEGSVSTAGSE